MAIIFIFTTIVLFLSLRHRSTFESTIFPLENSQTINGFFVIVVFLSHFGSYSVLSSSIDRSVQSFIAIAIGQTMVMTFFVFSGYGIYSSMIKKPLTRNQDMILRVKKLMLNISIAICVYVVYNYIAGNHFNTFEIIFSFIGWTSIGNSNWYIFTVLVLYILMLISFNVVKTDKYSIVILFVLTMVYSIGIAQIQPDYWVSTIFSFPLGVLIKFNEERILNFLSNKTISILAFIFFLVVFIALKVVFKSTWFVYNIETMLLLGMCVIMSTNFKIVNKQLIFLSKYVFEIYIYISV